MPQLLASILDQVRPETFLDIGITALLIYWMFSLIRGTSAVRLVIGDLSASPNIDMAGARMFLNLHAEMAKRGIVFRLVEARSTVRDILRTEGVEEKTGRIDRFTMLADAIDDFQKQPTANA